MSEELLKAQWDRIGDAAARKAHPLVSGCLDYFPDALLEVAALSKIGNDQHNPGQPIHWNRAKSGDEADALLRHLLDRGTLDNDGVRHSVKVAWRALALLQKELEAARDLPVSRGSKPSTPEAPPAAPSVPPFLPEVTGPARKDWLQKQVPGQYQGTPAPDLDRLDSRSLPEPRFVEAPGIHIPPGGTWKEVNRN